MLKFIMTIGLPASGKDTWIDKFIKNNPNDHFQVFSSDKVREELYSDEGIQGNPQEVFNLLNTRVLKACRRGENIIYNATNIKVKDRQNILKIVKGFKDYMLYAIIIGTTYGQCLENNRNRRNAGGRFVPEEVIKRMYYSFEPPHYFEGFNKIEVVYPFIKPYRDYKSEVQELRKLSHDCPKWHKLSVGDHILKAAHLCEADIRKGKHFGLDGEDAYKNYYTSIVPLILYMHDLGKKETKVFTDAKGNPSDTAHFYRHENVGAYNYMFYKIAETNYDCNIAAGICYHMKPQSWQHQKTEEKYKRLWGIRLFNLVKAINYYDEKSEGIDKKEHL